MSPLWIITLTFAGTGCIKLLSIKLLHAGEAQAWSKRLYYYRAAPAPRTHPPQTRAKATMAGKPPRKTASNSNLAVTALWKGPHTPCPLQKPSNLGEPSANNYKQRCSCPGGRIPAHKGQTILASALFSSQLSSQFNSHIYILWVSTFTHSDRGRAGSWAPSNVGIKRPVRSRSEHLKKVLFHHSCPFQHSWSDFGGILLSM